MSPSEAVEGRDVEIDVAGVVTRGTVAFMDEFERDEKKNDWVYWVDVSGFVHATPARYLARAQ